MAGLQADTGIGGPGQNGVEQGRAVQRQTVALCPGAAVADIQHLAPGAGLVAQHPGDAATGIFGDMAGADAVQYVLANRLDHQT